MTSPRFTPRQYTVITATRNDILQFRPMLLNDIPVIRPYLEAAPWRTCDFTIGGLLMWAQYFSYSYAISGDTLFIKGVTEDDVTRPAFSLPIGAMPLDRAIEKLKDYCRAHDAMPLTFSAVPEGGLQALRALGATAVTPLDDWSDYLYDASALATLSGKKLNKKRNHVNRFMADNPGYSFETLTPRLIPDVIRFFEATHLPLSKPAIADVEREQVLDVLRHVDQYGFEGAVLSTPSDGIVAFTLGEVIGDTLYVHIEKMSHDIAGAGETINRLFASMMTTIHPSVQYINREDDVGDPGLRHAKESYHPLELLKKYNVTM